MRRAQFLEITGLKPDYFNALVRKGMILGVPADRAGAWRDYSLKSAFLTHLALEMAALGPTQSEMTVFVERQQAILFHRASSLGRLADLERFFGYANVHEYIVDGDMARPTALITKRTLAGTFNQVSREISSILNKSSRERSMLGSVVLINASELLRDMINIARDAGFAENIREDVARIFEKDHL